MLGSFSVHRLVIKLHWIKEFALMVSLMIDGITVTAPSFARCHAAYEETMGRPGKVIIDLDPKEPPQVFVVPMGFAISPMTGQLTAVA